MKTGVQAQTRSVLFEAASDGIPTIDHFTFQEIEFINSRSGVFRRGELRFEEDKEEEIFDLLHYPEWKKTLLSENDIKNLVMIPNKDNAERIISIKDNNTIERIRGVMNSLINQQVDVSTKMKNIINERFKEIRNGKIKSDIVVGKIESPTVSVEEVDSLKEQLANMQKLMEKMMSQEKTTEVVKNEVEPEKTKPSTKTLSANKPKK